MVTFQSEEHPRAVLKTLLHMSGELEWVEFKENNFKPEEIGEYISALSNSAALLDKSSAYMVWGVDDKAHKIVGTIFDPRGAKIGNEELENWLLRLLAPKIDFQFLQLEEEGKRVVLLEIGAAFRHPVCFQGKEYIRVGSYKKPSNSNVYGRFPTPPDPLTTDPEDLWGGLGWDSVPTVGWEL